MLTSPIEPQSTRMRPCGDVHGHVWNRLQRAYINAHRHPGSTPSDHWRALRPAWECATINIQHANIQHSTIKHPIE